MDLSVNYLGLELRHPFVMGASPVVDDLDQVRRVADAGAAAIVMHSLFEEQLHHEEVHQYAVVDSHADAFAEALSYLPEQVDYHLGPDDYLRQLQRIKQAVDVPVIGSLNGTTKGGWLSYARLIEEAGADALELNLYALATNPRHSAADVERESIEVVREVKNATTLPVAIKLSPFYSSLPHFAAALEAAGADAIVLFNRFYQPDIDVEELEVSHTVHLSDSSELLLRLRWLAILSDQRELDFAVTGGVHTVVDAIKAIMAGAHAVQLVSQVLAHGPGCFESLPQQLSQWLDEHEYSSLDQMRGSMNMQHCPDPRAYERANYIRILQSWATDDV
jgi:dihydroorotate dehydrogenase (fumarate)